MSDGVFAPCRRCGQEKPVDQYCVSAKCNVHQGQQSAAAKPRPRVYIAGPISKGSLYHNIQHAEKAFFELQRAGLAPFCPHWSCYSGGPFHSEDGRLLAEATAGGGGGASHEDWLATDLAWVACSHAVLRLPGESVGADRECALAADMGIPVYFATRGLIADFQAGLIGCTIPEPPAGDPRFHAILKEMGDLHARKGADYGRGADVFANIRASEDFGVPAWKGAMVRLNDKVHRLKSFCQNGSLANEGVEDSLLDLACYSIIALVLFRESQQAKQAA